MCKKQFFIGLGLLVAFLIATWQLGIDHEKVAVFTILGLGMGYVMERSRFGFAGIVRKMYMTGDGSLAKAVLFLLVISTLVEAGLQYSAFIKGAPIPGIASVKVISLLTPIGGFLFGIGMMFGGGCASGTLTDIGEGFARAVVVLIFFCIGSVLGVHNLDFLQKTFLGAGGKVYLPEYIGYFNSLVAFFLVYALIYLGIRKYEAKRKKAGTLQLEEWEDFEKPLPADDEFKVISNKAFHKFFVERWSFFTGGVLISIIFLLIVITSGKNWGVSTEFAFWGAWVIQPFTDYDFTSISFFAKKADAFKNGFLMHGGSMRNLGFIVGTIVAALMTGNFKIRPNFTAKEFIIFALGGLFMGYGARIGHGCNIGAFYSALSSLSVSGFVFGTALMLGGITGLKLLKK